MLTKAKISKKIQIGTIPLPSFFGTLSLLLLAGIVALTGVHSAAAAWKPTKTVNIVVPARAGGGLDRVARLLQKIMQENNLVDKVTLLNKKGGGHVKALTFLSTKKGDAHYLEIESMTMLGKHIVGKSPFSYDAVTPIAMLFEENMCSGVPMNSKIKTATDIGKILKKDPSVLSIGFSGSPGSASHIGIAMPLEAMGVDVTKLRSIIYGGGSKIPVAVMGGHVDVGTTAHSTWAKKMKSGKMRLLACTGTKRLHGSLKDVPTWKELGVDIEYANFRTIVGPLGLSKAQLAFWDKTFAKIVKSKMWKKVLSKRDYHLTYKNSTEAPAAFKAKYEQAKKILTSLGLAKVK